MSTKNTLGRILLSGASLAAIGAMSPAFAQDEVSEEIVVTATGRAAAIQDVPIAVTAVSGDALQNSGAQDLRDVVQVAPSLYTFTGQSNSSSTTVYVRGIGTGSDNPGFEGAVGIFIDGVYRARAGAALSDLPELVRVEVLRGPQGTLFGRNTSAGAISVVTAGPDFAPGMYLEGTYGLDDLEETGARAGVNLPISDTLAVRVDGSIRARDGFITDSISGQDINTRDRWSARAQALWDITPDASLRVIVDGSQTDEVCCGVTPAFYGVTQPAVTAIVGAAGSPTPNPEGRRMTVTPALAGLPQIGAIPAQPATDARDYGEAVDDFGVSGELDWRIGDLNLTSITAWRDWKADRSQDIDFNLIDIAYRDGLTVNFENFTQEFRLQGETGRVNWLVGLFYGDETLKTTDTIRLGSHLNLFANALARGATISPLTPLGCELYDSTTGDVDFATDPIPSFFACAAGNPALGGTYLIGNVAGQGQQADTWNVDTQTIALFTHNEINLSDNLVLTIGARYNDESKDLNANLLSTSNSCLSLQGVELATDAATPGPGGLISVLQNNPAASGLMNIACSPAVNPIANGNWTGSTDSQEISGTVSLAYHLSDDVLLYGGYSRGFKAGGFNVDRQGFAVTPATVNPASLNVGQLMFDPEFTDAYELGLKTTLFDGAATFNVTGFYQQITDFQLNAFNGFNFITRNIPDVVSQGAEIEASASPFNGLTLTGGVVYTDAYFDSTVLFNPLNPGPNTVNAGDELSFSPDWVVTGSITYEMPLGDDMRALFYLDGRWNSEYRVQTLNHDPRTDNDAFAIFNGRIGFGPNDERWSIEFWGRNLFDEFYNVGAFAAPLQDTVVIYPSEPRTYGVTVRARY